MAERRRDYTQARGIPGDPTGDLLGQGPQFGICPLDHNRLVPLEHLPFGLEAVREVVLTFSALVAVGTAINIQTGVYAGAGSPATVDYDVDVTLPITGAAFRGDARIMVNLNGQELTKGDGTGNGDAEWVSSTQIKLGIKIKSGGQVHVRAPFPTA